MQTTIKKDWYREFQIIHIIGSTCLVFRELFDRTRQNLMAITCIPVWGLIKSYMHLIVLEGKEFLSSI